MMEAVYDVKKNMGTGFLWFIGASCLAAFGVLLRFALQALQERKYSTSAAWFFWSFMLLAIVCAVLVSQGEPNVSQAMRNIVLGSLGAIMGASLFIWGGYAFWENATTQTKDAEMTKENSLIGPIVSGNNNVVSIGQSGGVTAGTYINQVPQPKLNLIEQSDLVNYDGTHSTTFTVEVVSQITPAFLAIDIIANDILEASIMPPPIGGVSTINLRNVRRGPTSYHAELTSPRGRYFVSVQTKGKTPISLNYSF